VRVYRHIGSLLVALALLAPVGMVASTNFQDDHQGDKHRDRDANNQKRYYDKNHKDYHTWDDREAGVYQRWASDNHIDNRDFSHLKGKQQAEYWNWRHDHPDVDADRH
jgi:hypothetical protein